MAAVLEASLSQEGTSEVREGRELAWPAEGHVSSSVTQENRSKSEKSHVPTNVSIARSAAPSASEFQDSRRDLPRSFPFRHLGADCCLVAHSRGRQTRLWCENIKQPVFHLDFSSFSSQLSNIQSH